MRTAAALTTAVLLGAVALAGATPVSAQAPAKAAGSNLCPASNVCIYTDNNYVGLLGYRSAGGGLANVSASANDKTDSWENKSGTNAAWYYDTNGGGNCYTMAAKTQNPNLGVFPSDELSSWRTNRGC